MLNHYSLPTLLQNADPEPAYNSGSGEAFQTRAQSGRRRIPQTIPATFAAAEQPAVFPVAALGAPVVRRRRDTTNRRVLEVGDITSALVAPLIGSLPRPKANVVWFDRTIRLPQPLAIYPPPTGPPASDALVFSEPFFTARVRSRKLQPNQPAPFFTAATPLAGVTFPAPAANRRHDGERRLQQPLLAEFAPTPPSTSPVTVAALAARKLHRRRQRHGLLLSGGAGIFDGTAAGTSQVTPAALHQQGHFKRRDTERRLQSVTPLAEFTVATTTTSDARVSGDAFSTRKQRGRKRLPTPALASFDAAPPVTAPVIALPIPKAIHRRPRRGVLLTGGDGVFQPPYIVLPAPKANRVEHRRKLVKTAALAVFTGAAPPPAQPIFSGKTTRRQETRRKLVKIQPLATYTFAAPPTFAVVALPPPKVRKVHGLGRRLLLAPIWLDIPAATPAKSETGGGFWDYAMRHRAERDRARRRLLEIERETQDIDDSQTREIARLLRIQAEKQAEQVELQRLQSLADTYSGQRINLPRDVSAALINAQVERTRNSLLQLQREIAQMLEEEEAMVIALLMLDD